LPVIVKTEPPPDCTQLLPPEQQAPLEPVTVIEDAESKVILSVAVNVIDAANPFADGEGLFAIDCNVAEFPSIFEAFNAKVIADPVCAFIVEDDMFNF